MASSPIMNLTNSVSPSATTVTTTATAIPSTAKISRRTMLVYNNGDETVYLGDSGVTAVNGYPLGPGQEIVFNLDEDLIVYGITESGTSDVRSFEGA